MSPEPGPLPPRVEWKVKWAALATFVGVSVLLIVLEAIGADPELISPAPDWLEGPLLAIVPALITLFAGIRAPHTPRPDLPMHER